MGKLVPFIPGTVVALFNTGLQVSGYTNFPLAMTLWIVAAFLLIIPIWHYHANWMPRFQPVATALRELINFGPALSERIPIIEFRDYARDHFGWNYASEKRLDGLDLPAGLRQAALDGTIRFWGRPNRNMFTDLTRGEPLNEIPSGHWANYDLDAISIITATDNFATITRNLRDLKNANEGGFVDLYLDGAAADRWLRTEAEKFRGFTDRRKTR